MFYHSATIFICVVCDGMFESVTELHDKGWYRQYGGILFFVSALTLYRLLPKKVI